MAMLAIGAGIAAAGSIAGGAIAAGGASAAGAAAAKAGQGAYHQAQDQAQMDEYFASPFYQTGAEATNALAKAYGLGHLVPHPGGGQDLVTTDQAGDRAQALQDFQTSPGYNFRLQQGVNALDRSASARGMTLSGGQQKALSDYGQGTGSAEWGNYLGGLSSLSGMGAGQANSLMQGTNGILKTGIDNAFTGNMGQASSYSNAANALANGISKGAQTFGSAIGNMGGGAGFGSY